MLGDGRKSCWNGSNTVRHELARTVRQLEDEALDRCQTRAPCVVADALQRVAASR